MRCTVVGLRADMSPHAPNRAAQGSRERRTKRRNTSRPNMRISWLERCLHHRAEGPRYELVLAVAVHFALCLAARRGLEHEAEDALAHRVDARAAVDDVAAVDVDVVFLLEPERGVGRELERRRRRAAVG